MRRQHPEDGRRQDGGKRRSQTLNTGLADALAGLSFKPLPTASRHAPNMQAAPTGTPQHHSAFSNPRGGHRDARTAKSGAASINDGLADAFERAMKHEAAPPPPAADRQEAPQAKPQRQPKAHRRPKGPPHAANRAGKPATLPSRFLRRREDLPEWESTGNFVWVTVSGVEYAYPIHSWVPVMDLCEAIFREYANRVMVRAQSRRAIKAIVQEHCNHGPFNLIPRSVVERLIRKRLALMFPTPADGAPKTTPAPHAEPAGSTQATQQPPPLPTYQERIRAYRTRHPRDAADAPTAVRDRLDRYIAMKVRRAGDQPVYSMEKAFTRKSSEASRTVWVGLDFGTQNMKAAFRDAESDDQSVILELNPAARGIDRYMLAPRTLLRGDQLVHVRDGAGGDTPSWKHALSLFYGDSYTTEDRRLKAWLDRSRNQCALLKDRSAEDLVHFFTSMHVAFLLATVGEAIRAYYRDRDIDDPLAFRVFMCAPVAALDQQLSQSVFQDCLTLADEMHALLDFSQAQVSVHDALNAYDQACKLGILLEKRPCRRSRVVPEVLAEIASFAQSRSAQQGIYALVDIGAGTLDLNVFKVLAATQDTGVRTPVWAASCHPNGVEHLEHVLRQALNGEGDTLPERFAEQKQRRIFPDIHSLAKACGKQDGIIGRLGTAHRRYCEDVATRTRYTWAEAWDKRGLEREVFSRLTLFLCGGGASIRDVRKHLEAGMPRQIIQRISNRVLPCPSEDECVIPTGFPEQDFHRVAVAYGLTFGSDFEPFLLPNQVHHVRVHRETVDVESRFISKDMV